MNITLSLAPLISLIAGILILIVPRMLNYIVAAYLIVVGNRWPGLSQANIAEQPKYPDDDQIGGDNIVQHPGHEDNENTGNQRY